MIDRQKTRKSSRKKVRGEALSALMAGHDSVVTNSSHETPSHTNHIMEEVLTRNNLNKALKQVISNKGCAGADGMTVEELPEYLRQNWVEIRQMLLDGSYTPGSILRKTIPKPGGGSRNLGIPTVVDRLIQQALQQKLSEIWDESFSDSSFGFRPKRSCHQAIRRAQHYIKQGYTTTVDIDLEQFFDRVNHDRLMGRLAKRIEDKRILRLIRKYLRAGILENGLVRTPDEGTPQGGPLSPILSNIVLDELDKELEMRGHKFVRYADDCNIYVRSERAGRRVVSSVSNFIEKKLKLKVNASKSATGPVSSRKFLGFSFTENNPEKIRISDQSVKRFKERVRNLTGKTHLDLEGQIRKLSVFLKGWIGYYGICETPSTIRSLDQWVRRRLRMLHLKMWRKPHTRWTQFSRLGMSKHDLRFITHTTKRYWYLSGTRAIAFTLNLDYFRKVDLCFMMDRYELQSN